MGPRSAIAVMLVCTAPAPLQAAVVLDFSLYTLGNYTEDGGSRIGGGVAVAGDAVINAVEIGTHLTSKSDKLPVVVVGGNIQFDNSKLAHGSVFYGGKNGSGEYTQTVTLAGSFEPGTPLDFGGTSAGLLALSSEYARQAVTGSFSSHWDAGTLTGTSKEGTDVFSLSSKELTSIYSLRLIGTGATKAIINITGSEFSHYFEFLSENYAQSDIVFNFVDATQIGFHGNNLAASVLAPFASITQSGGNIGGSIVARDYRSAGAIIGGDGGFKVAAGAGGGEAVGAVPEPASWAMMIGGFGLVGIMMRRRRRQPVVA